MKKTLEILAQLLPAVLLLIHFLVPSDSVENARLSYVIFVIKNSIFEIILLALIALIIAVRPLKEKIFSFVKNEWSVVSKTNSFSKKLVVLVNVSLLLLISGMLLNKVLRQRKQHFTGIKQSYYSESLRQAKFLAEKGDLDGAIKSYNSFGVSLLRVSDEGNALVNDRIDRLKFKKQLSEMFYQNFEQSFNTNGYTRVNFSVLLESYFLNPYNPIIENRTLSSFDFLIKGMESWELYYLSVLNDDFNSVQRLDSLYGHLFLENGIIKSKPYTKQYKKDIKELFVKLNKDEFYAYLHESWRTNEIEGKLLAVKRNKELEL